MVNQVESFIRCFPDMKPGWIYDKENKRMVGDVVAPSTISSTDIEPHVALSEETLRKLIETENKKNLVWFEEFENSTEKHSFVLSVTGIHIDKLKSLKSVTEGTVTEVKYLKCLKMLVCSTEESSFDECSEYLEKILGGKEAELSSKICESCKKCYIYNLYLTGERKIQDFISIMSCFKEFTRIIDVRKFSTNCELFSFKYVTQFGSKDLHLCSNSEDMNANVYDGSNIIPDNRCSEGTKNSCQRFDKCSDFTGETEKCTCNHSEAAAHKVQSLKKRTKMDKVNSTGQSTEITVAKRSSQKKNSEDLKSKIDPKKSIRVKECHKAQYNNSDQFQNFGSESSIQKVEGTEVSMALSEHISNDFEKSNSENGLVDVNPSSQSKEFPYLMEDSKFASNNLEPFCCDTDHIYSDERMSSLEIDTRQTGTLMKRNESLNYVIPLHRSYPKEDEQEQLKALTDDPDGNTKFFEDYKVENNCENSLFENDVELKDGNRDVCVNHDQLEPDLRCETSHLEKLDPSKTPIQSSFSIASLEGHNIQKKTIYYGEIKIISTITELNGIRKVEIGNRMREGKGKVIILLGATGSGKTSLVNLCANFFFGAKNADEEKLFVVDPKTKTDRVTVYTFYPEGDCQTHLTVVDTPGLNDSTGAEIHDHVDALKSFLALACSQGLEINALAFVAQAHLVRLTSSEKLVMNYVRSLFGSEVEKHIMALVTFSDNQPTPPVIEAMEQYGFKSPFFVKFNNTLLISKTEAVDDLDRIYWRTGMRSWRKCVRHLSTMESFSNCAIASVKNEVFNKAVLNKYQSNLDAEIRNFITLCNKNIEIEEFYYDQGLISARNKLWIASNDAYNVEANVTVINKELFLINACHIHLENDLISIRSATIKLFLLMHKESSLKCVLKCLVSALLKCLYCFNVHSNSEENYLSLLCIICSKYSKHEKVGYDKDKNETKFKCTSCNDSSGVHLPPQEDSKLPDLRFLTQRQLYMHTVRLIRNEVSKYESLNCGVEDFWTLGDVLRNMQLSESFEYQHDEINIILEKLYAVAEEERL